jgi:hypothetical protein
MAGCSELVGLHHQRDIRKLLPVQGVFRTQQQDLEVFSSHQDINSQQVREGFSSRRHLGGSNSLQDQVGILNHMRQEGTPSPLHKTDSSHKARLEDINSQEQSQGGSKLVATLLGALALRHQPRIRVDTGNLTLSSQPGSILLLTGAIRLVPSVRPIKLGHLTPLPQVGCSPPRFPVLTSTLPRRVALVGILQTRPSDR